jgi:hypothetical protein
MNERKNIDRLFQEKFKDFEVDAPEGAWANIEARLDGKKKRRIIPFWWKLSGVAAVFLIGFMVSKSIYDGDVKPENAVVNQENSSGTKSKDTTKNGFKTNKQIQNETPIAHETNLSKNEDYVSGKKELKNNNSIKNENAVANATNSNKTEKSGSKKGLRNNEPYSSNGVVTTSDEVKTNASSERKNKIKNTLNSSESSVAGSNATKQRSLKNKTNSEINKEAITESVFEKSKNQIAQNSKDNTESTAEKEIVQTTKDKNSKIAIDAKNINLDGLKGESNSEIIAQEIVKKVNDTTAKNSVVLNALEELLNEKESKTKQESKRNRWQLTSNVAPVFLGSIADGSPIDSTLNKNSKSYNTNVGFGVGVSYAVNKKLSVRTGLNKVNVSYNTNDVSFFSAIQARTMSNITPTASSSNIQIQSTASTTTQVVSETALLPFESSFVNTNSGYLRQEMGYLEMPVEMTYNLLDKKFGIKIIGGFSTLFLQDNNIVIISEGRDTLLGEANNLNDVHFSTNLGLGIKYGFMKSFEFNVEPTLKYQLNTFSDSAGNFKPYIFGIYSGISYKF